MRYLELRSAAGVIRAIKRLQVRGAPWIGVSAAYGLAAEAQRLKDKDLRRGLRRAARSLRAARPTAVNLSWAVERMLRSIEDPTLTPGRLRKALFAEARCIEAEERRRSFSIARYGAGLIRDGYHIITICNTGVLAAPGLGTALGVIFRAHRAGKRLKVYVCETRPLLQGARLTTFELRRAGIPFVLIPDSAAATVIERCDMVLVGADRIALNGDTANKVGTRMLAVLARAAKKPFYVAAPSSSFDPRADSGSDIVIEERAGEEVRRFGRCVVVPSAVPVFNPAFDITPARFITGIITESGVIKPPFVKSIRRLLFS